MALRTCIVTVDNFNQTACRRVETEEDKLGEASTGLGQGRLHIDVAALLSSINSGKELFCCQVLLHMEHLALTPRLWFLALQHETVYFVNLFKYLKYARASFHES